MKVEPRWQRLTGLVGLVLLFTALFLPGQPPKASDTTAALTADIVGHRTALVVGILLAGFGLLAFLWFCAVLGAAVSRSTPVASPLPMAAVVGGVAGVLLLFVGMLVFSGLGFRAARFGDPSMVRFTVDTGNMLIEASKYGFALLILATCATGSGRLLSSGMIAAGRIAAVILVASTVSPYLVDHGVGQFGGGIDVIGGLPAFVWLLCLSLTFVFAKLPTA